MPTIANLWEGSSEVLTSDLGDFNAPWDFRLVFLAKRAGLGRAARLRAIEGSNLFLVIS
jgi:hypothetical protein